ncbi:MAG: hypothetical protein OXU20_11795, partial [Myxococcales bacterium]|nr:hypothetical protein [Myxococcales bacterium]
WMDTWPTGALAMCGCMIVTWVNDNPTNMLPTSHGLWSLASQSKPGIWSGHAGEGAHAHNCGEKSMPPPWRSLTTMPVPIAHDSGTRGGPSGDASSARLPSGDASNARLPSGDASSARLPSGDASNARLPSGDASSARLPSGDASNARLGDASRAFAVGLAQTNQPVLIVTAQGAIVFGNPAFERLAQPTARPISLHDVLHAEAADHILEQALTLHDQQGFTVEALLRRSDSADHLERHGCETAERLRLQATVCVDEHKCLRHVVLTAPPAPPAPRPGESTGLATSGQEPSLEARALFGLAGRVVGELAHDLNNELSILLNYSFVLLRRAQRAEPPLQEHLAELQRAAWRASGIGRAFVRFGRQRNADQGRCDLVSTVRGMEPVMNLSLMGSRALVVDTPDTALLAQVPRGRLELLLLRAAVLANSLPPERPLCVDLRVQPRTSGGSEAVLQVGPTLTEGVHLPGQGPEGPAADSGLLARLRDSFERAGTVLETIPLGDDTATLELRVTLDED